MSLYDLVDATTQLVDVRTTEEFAAGHIANALNIPLASLNDRKQEISDLDVKPVVFYCRSGNRSALAVLQLRQAGHELVYNGGSLDEVQALLRRKGIR